MWNSIMIEYRYSVVVYSWTIWTASRMGKMCYFSGWINQQQRLCLLIDSRATPSLEAMEPGGRSDVLRVCVREKWCMRKWTCEKTNRLGFSRTDWHVVTKERERQRRALTIRSRIVGWGRWVWVYNRSHRRLTKGAIVAENKLWPKGGCRINFHRLDKGIDDIR